MDEELLKQQQTTMEGQNSGTSPETAINSEETVVNDNVTEPPITEENGVVETSYKTFTQPEVDKMIGDTRVKTREKTFKYIYDRYGVNNEEELDSLVANAQRFETSRDIWDEEKRSFEQERDTSKQQIQDMSEQLALMQSEIDPSRYEDAKLIIKGKGMEVTVENIQNELATHPEWAKGFGSKSEPGQEPAPEPGVNPGPEPGQEPGAPMGSEQGQPTEKPIPQTTTRITALGNEPKPAPGMSEEEEAERLFKMKFH